MWPILLLVNGELNDNDDPHLLQLASKAVPKAHRPERPEKPSGAFSRRQACYLGPSPYSGQARSAKAVSPIPRVCAADPVAFFGGLQE